MQFPIVTKTGETIWLAQNVQFILHEGEIVEAAAVARDFTKRKMTEDALKTTQLRLTSLISNLQSGILVEDENRHIVLANALFCKQFNILLPRSLDWCGLFQFSGGDKKALQRPSNICKKYRNPFERKADKGERGNGNGRWQNPAA
jgi:PAS domain-containing protein